MKTKHSRVDNGTILFLVWGFLAVLLFLNQGCGGDQAPTNEGFHDRFDACERAVSLCRLSRGALTPCVDWVEENFPNDVDRILLVQCMMEAPDCANMIDQCNLQGDWIDAGP